MATLVATPNKKASDGFATERKFPASTKKCSLLDQFVEQEEQMPEKKQQVTTNKNVAKIEFCFKEFLNMQGIHNQEYPIALNAVFSTPGFSIKNSVLKFLGKNPYSAKDIEMFSLNLWQFENYITGKPGSLETFSRRTGLFLSALVNTSLDKDFTIVAENLSNPPMCVGEYNLKNLTIIGNVYGELGRDMERGSITINGNVDLHVGIEMRGGLITVNGNVKDTVGQWACGGTIIVNGDVEKSAGYGMYAGGTLIVNGNTGKDTCLAIFGGDVTINGNVNGQLCENMKGGTVKVNGNIARIGPGIKDGNIFQRGRQLVKDGKQIADIQNE